MTKNKKTNNSIKCDVESCKYNDCEANECELDEVKIGCSCNNDNCTSTSETKCESFEENTDTDKKMPDDDIDEEITDTEYEVTQEEDDTLAN